MYVSLALALIGHDYKVMDILKAAMSGTESTESSCCVVVASGFIITLGCCRR